MSVDRGSLFKRGVKRWCRAMGSAGRGEQAPGRRQRGRQMPLFMDTHSIEGGVSAGDAAAAHQADLATQAGYGVRYLRYWVDKEGGRIFCLVEAPDAEAANTVHQHAHGLVAVESYLVSAHT